MVRALLLGLLVGCGSSPVAVCAGNHVGTFEGSDVGTLQATLDEKGLAKVTLVGESSGTLSSEGAIDDDGTISLGGLVSVEGTLDLQTCESSGTWEQNLAGLSGSWSMVLE